MTKVILIAQVDNVDSWEKAFRSHGELFRSQGAMSSPVLYSRGMNNEVALCSEVTDVSSYRNMVMAQETITAMEQDGVRVSSVKLYVLDKELSF